MYDAQELGDAGSIYLVDDEAARQKFDENDPGSRLDLEVFRILVLVVVNDREALIDHDVEDYAERPDVVLLGGPHLLLVAGQDDVLARDDVFPRAAVDYSR